MAGFREALAVVFEAEGGLADDPHDTGGRTHFGISTPVWETCRDQLGKPGQPVDACTRENAEWIYFTRYWHGGRCDGLAWPLSLVHFDSMVQHGVAAKLLQRTVGAEDDGIIGRKTLARAGEWDAAKAAEALLWARVEYYTGLRSWPHHGKGWMRRLATLRRYVVGTRPLPRVA